MVHILHSSLDSLWLVGRLSTCWSNPFISYLWLMDRRSITRLCPLSSLLGNSLLEQLIHLAVPVPLLICLISEIKILNINACLSSVPIMDWSIMDLQIPSTHTFSLEMNIKSDIMSWCHTIRSDWLGYAAFIHAFIQCLSGRAGIPLLHQWMTFFYKSFTLLSSNALKTDGPK